MFIYHRNIMLVEIIKFDTRASFDAGTLRVSWEIYDCNLISAARRLEVIYIHAFLLL